MREKLKALLEEFTKGTSEQWWSFSIQNQHGLSLRVTNMYADSDKVQVYEMEKDGTSERGLLRFNATIDEAVELFCKSLIGSNATS